MILHYFKRNENIQNEIDNNIYKLIIEIINKLYSNDKFKLKKDFNSSFEITTFLLFIVFFTFKNKSYKSEKQELINKFINDLDYSLRNLGIGDMSIGKYVKKYVKKIYFRFDLYDKIFEKQDKDKFQIFFNKLEILINNNNLLSSYLFDLACKSIKLSKSRKFNEFKFYLN
tara:strand:- start:16 stop:528 length:513 start_codon:yes stop_codon:yes gene_type:complete